MRIHMEGVRLESCDLIEAAVRASKKIERSLVEASVRTPATISSKQLIDESIQLVLGLENILSLLLEKCR